MKITFDLVQHNDLRSELDTLPLYLCDKLIMVEHPNKSQEISLMSRTRTCGFGQRHEGKPRDGCLYCSFYQKTIDWGARVS